MKALMKTFEYNGEIITIELISYGEYMLRGLNASVRCTDSEVWDWCNDDSNEFKFEEAKKTAYNMLTMKI